MLLALRLLAWIYSLSAASIIYRSLSWRPLRPNPSNQAYLIILNITGIMIHDRIMTFYYYYKYDQSQIICPKPICLMPQGFLYYH
jgi:hypothetical protein